MLCFFPPRWILLHSDLGGVWVPFLFCFSHTLGTCCLVPWCKLWHVHASNFVGGFPTLDGGVFFVFSVTAGAAGLAETVEVEIGRLGVWMPVELRPETGEPVDTTLGPSPDAAAVMY